MAIQVQIQVLLTAMGGETMGESNIGSSIKMVKLPVFNGEAEKVEGFIMVCRLYIIYTRRISRCVEKESVRRFGNRGSRI